MPIYEYEPVSGDCKICGGHLELNRPVTRPKLTHCPLCKKEVRQCVSSFKTLSGKASFSASRAKNAGFTIMKKVDHGVYEKT